MAVFFCSAVLASSVERDCVLKIPGRIENANFAFSETAPLPRIVERVAFRISAHEVWLDARCFERLPAAAVRADFDDALGLDCAEHT